MIQVSGISLTLDAGFLLEQACRDATRHASFTADNPLLNEQQLPASIVEEVAQALSCSPDAVTKIQLRKCSVDARKKTNIHFVVTLGVVLSEEHEKRLLAHPPKRIAVSPAKSYVPLEIAQHTRPKCPPVVVGSGPAGLFAALYLARAGLCPVVLEQGTDVHQRKKDVEVFNATGKLNPYSNIQFGEGGAGTFSDGKLTTNTKNPFTAHVLRWFVQAGAPPEILWQAHPHVGSNNLGHIVEAMRNEIIQRGGKVLFNTRLIDVAFSQGALVSLTTKQVQTGETHELPAQNLILACGHSARDVFELCHSKGLAMEQKPFSVGVRIEHPQSAINKAQWAGAANHPALGAAEYKMAVHLPNGRSVYTFCMCPGGSVVAAASEEGGVVTNGMSDFSRAGGNANAALLVSVSPADFPSNDVLSGISFQRRIERAAYESVRTLGGAPYQAPCQTVAEFLGDAHDASKSASSTTTTALCGQQQNTPLWCTSTYPRGVVNVPLSECLPPFVMDSLKQALPLLGRRLKGFNDPRALLTAPETRSSSPVRICRTSTFEAYFDQNVSALPVISASSAEICHTGLFPCGEGPGFAGGIMSAAVDGLRVAQEVASRYPEKTEKQAYIDQACALLKQGKPIIFPTDTLYGLGVSVQHAQSPDVLYALKNRKAAKPIAWLVAHPEALARYGKGVPEYAQVIARTYWPGPLTLIVEASAAVPSSFASSKHTIGLRMPNNAFALSLIDQLGCPLATTSANMSGESSPVDFAALNPTLVRSVAGAFDDEEPKSGVASTIVDCTGKHPVVVRQGAISTAEIQALL